MPQKLARTLKAIRSRPCRCGHSRPAHTHYRAGDDCGLCGCLRWSAWRQR